MEAARSWKLHGDAQLQLGGAEEAARASAALPIFSRPFDAFKREHTCFCGDALSVNNAFSSLQCQNGPSQFLRKFLLVQ